MVGRRTGPFLSPVSKIRPGRFAIQSMRVRFLPANCGIRVPPPDPRANAGAIFLDRWTREAGLGPPRLSWLLASDEEDAPRHATHAHAQCVRGSVEPQRGRAGPGRPEPAWLLPVRRERLLGGRPAFAPAQGDLYAAPGDARAGRPADARPRRRGGRRDARLG